MRARLPGKGEIRGALWDCRRQKGLGPCGGAGLGPATGGAPAGVRRVPSGSSGCEHGGDKPEELPSELIAAGTNHCWPRCAGWSVTERWCDGGFAQG